MSTSLLQHHVPLAPLTTLGVGGEAKLLIEVASTDELVDAVKYAKDNGLKWAILGGGSNTLVPDTGYDGLVIKMSIAGIEQLASVSSGMVLLKVGAGENFDSLVAHTAGNGWWGLENLSAIPGTVGATPIQNVGAYGVDVSQVIDSVAVFDTATDTHLSMSNEECEFGYRTSVFKREPGRFIITSVLFRLTLAGEPKCTYSDFARYFEGSGIPSLSQVRTAVIDIRSKKFPDWTRVGTAGSFFKNPIVKRSEASELLEKFPELPNYGEGEDRVKLSLGYILDKVCGLKGYKKGAVGLYKEQALVLVVAKNTSAQEVISFADEVAKKVFEQTKIKIEKEVTILK